MVAADGYVADGCTAPTEMRSWGRLERQDPPEVQQAVLHGPSAARNLSNAPIEAE
jgi:hypothetical protein